MESKMNTVIAKITSAFTADLKDTLKDFAYHLAKEWEIDESKIPEAIASYKYTPGGNKKEKKAKDPDAPKRPKNAYLFFCAARRPELKEENYSAQEIMSQLGSDWQELSEEDRSKYKALAVEDKERYTNETKEYAPKECTQSTTKNTVPKNADKLSKQKNAMLAAAKKSEENADDKLYCYNLSTSRTIVYNDKKPGDRIWDTKNYVCAKTQEEIDNFLSQFVEKDVDEEEHEKTEEKSDSDESVVDETERICQDQEVEENIINTDDEKSKQRFDESKDEESEDEESEDEEMRIQLQKQKERRARKINKKKLN